MTVKVKMGRETCDVVGRFLMHVDFVTDHVDLVVNPAYQTFDSDVVRWKMSDCGVEGPYEMIDGDVFPSGLQYVTVCLYNPEDLVKLKLLMRHINSEYQYTKEDLMS